MPYFIPYIYTIGPVFGLLLGSLIISMRGAQDNAPGIDCKMARQNAQMQRPVSASAAGRGMQKTGSMGRLEQQQMQRQATASGTGIVWHLPGALFFKYYVFLGTVWCLLVSV